MLSLFLLVLPFRGVAVRNTLCMYTGTIFVVSSIAATEHCLSVDVGACRCGVDSCLAGIDICDHEMREALLPSPG